MGSQQLLLIVLAVVLIGIMITVGMDMFKDQASATSRDAISNDLVHYAVQAQKYHRKPRVIGGGQNTFSGLTLAYITKKASNANATYALSPDPASASDPFVKVSGTGYNDGTDGTTPVKMEITVWADSAFLQTLN